MICKTISLNSQLVRNVTPRYAKLRSPSNFNEVIGWENIELISDRPTEVRKIREMETALLWLFFLLVLLSRIIV